MFRDAISKTSILLLAVVIVVAVVGVVLMYPALTPSTLTPTPTPTTSPTTPKLTTTPPQFPLPNWPPELVIRGFSAGTAGYLIMGVIGSMISEQLKVKTTVQPGTGLPNFIAVANGEVDIAMSYTLWSNIYVKGYHTELGLTPADPSKVAFLIGSSEADYHALVIAHKDLPANTFAELIELIKQGIAKPVVPASAKSVDEFIYRALFKKYGLEWGQFKIPTPGGDPAVESFIEGKYNVLLDASPLASPQWQQIDTRVPDMVKVIYFSDDDINYVINYFGEGSFVKSTIPKGLYSFIKEDYPSLASSQIIIVRADLPEDLVYYIAKLLDENRPVIASSVAAFETYNPAKAILTGGLQIHPGAERYYREKGYIK